MCLRSLAVPFNYDFEHRNENVHRQPLNAIQPADAKIDSHTGQFEAKAASECVTIIIIFIQTEREFSNENKLPAIRRTYRRINYLLCVCTRSLARSHLLSNIEFILCLLWSLWRLVLVFIVWIRLTHKIGAQTAFVIWLARATRRSQLATRILQFKKIIIFKSIFTQMCFSHLFLSVSNCVLSR